METYPYHENIKTPEKLGVSDKGNLTALGNNIKAMQGYVGVLVTGDSKAQRASPLGNQYFMDTGTTCKDMNGDSQARYAYVNNIPDGTIPLISSAMGQNTSQYKGLVPGILEDMGYLDPASIFNAFQPETACQQITMATRDNENANSTESRYVTQADIKTYNPCWFPKKKNPVTNEKCEGMANMNPKDKDLFLQFYILLLGLLLMYVLHRAMK
jgi:hypothetical protein